MTSTLPGLGASKRGRLLWRSAFAATLAVATGCSSPDAETLGSTQLAAYMNEKTVYDYFVGKGLTNFQSAGVVGNLIQESGLDPTIHQFNNGPGRGLAQWSAGARWDTTDGDNVADYAAEHGGQSVYSLTLQLDFIWYELTTFSNYGLAELKASTTLQQATQAFEDKFEGCVYANYPVCNLPQRVKFAGEIFDVYGDTGGTAGTSGGGTGGGGNAGSGGAAGASGAGGASGGAGSGGVSAGGVSSAGAAGTPASTSGGATAGNASVAGSSSSAGSTSIAGSAGVAGGASVAGSGFTNPSFSNTRDNSGCAFSAPKPRSGEGSWLVLGMLMATTLRFGRRRQQ